jgi:hypothetical protein
MRRWIPVAILIVVQWPTVASAVPAPKERPQEKVEFAGTVWEGIDGPMGDLGYTRYTFEADGKLSWTDKEGSSPKMGSWKVDGNTLYFETCGKYREFRGQIERNVVSGESWNVAGQRWSLTIRRAEPGK